VIDKQIYVLIVGGEESSSMAQSREQEQQVSFCLSIINVILVALVVVVHGVTDPDDGGWGRQFFTLLNQSRLL
jgi:hypothetical protein